MAIEMLLLGPVRPKFSQDILIDRKGTTVLVAGRLKCLRFQDSWCEADHGWSTAWMKTKHAAILLSSFPTKIQRFV